jgi:hypothetical protein
MTSMVFIEIVVLVAALPPVLRELRPYLPLLSSRACSHHVRIITAAQPTPLPDGKPRRKPRG